MRRAPRREQINKANGLDETGAQVPGRGDTPNQHDIITGSTAAGVSSGNTCNDWTSSAASGVTATLGHFDRMGVAGNMAWPSGWVSRASRAELLGDVAGEHHELVASAAAIAIGEPSTAPGRGHRAGPGRGRRQGPARRRWQSSLDHQSG